MSDVKKWMMTSRAFAITLFMAISVIVVILITLGIVVGRNTWLTIKISTICPDYFAEEYAYIVDENGKGIDSVTVSLWDNSDFNMIYRTFTDSTGRFVLFHDFGSFALHNMPFSYYLYISVDGWSDTIRYSFEKHRVCHFRKKDGPDTIVCSSDQRSNVLLRIYEASKTIIDSGFSFIPPKQCALRTGKPSWLSDSLPFEHLFYGDISVGEYKIPFVLLPVADYQITGNAGTILTEGVWYCLDRNGDGKLSDETFVQLIGRSGGSAAKCFLGSCSVVDSVNCRAQNIVFECSISGADGAEPVLSYRRIDALKGTVTLDSIRYSTILWDAGATLYADRAQVVFAVDVNRDGKFSFKEGSSELYEHTRGTIRLGKVSFLVDTITADGRTIIGSHSIKDSVPSVSFDATPGTWAKDAAATVSQPFSLYQTCAANKYLVLYFFEGNTARYMQQPAIQAFVALANEQLGQTYLLGVNRRAVGSVVSDYPVVNENRGWAGPLVTQFHNFRDVEIVCLDNTATIIYRGAVTAAAISALWGDAGVDDAVSQLLFKQQTTNTMVSRE